MTIKTKQEILDDAYKAILIGSYNEAELLVKLARAMGGDVRRVRY